MTEPSKPTLNHRRDAYVQRVKAVFVKAEQVFETQEQRGIASRTQSVLNTQLQTLDELADEDLEAAGGVQDRVELLLRAQHLPRMLLAFLGVYREDEEKVLTPERITSMTVFRNEVLLLAQDLGTLIEAWVLDHREELEALGEQLDL